jgi:bleomycin hydrolase
LYNKLYKINMNMKKIVVGAFIILSSINCIAQADKGAVAKPLEAPKLANEKAIAGGKEAQSKLGVENLAAVKSLPVSVIKNQGMTGTCWCFATTSLVESQCIKNNIGDFDLSEMFAVRYTYVEKAKQYILRQGHTQFGEGGLGHDLINAIAKYGAVPESIYSGAKPTLLTYRTKFDAGTKKDTIPVAKSMEGVEAVQHNHVKLIEALKKYLDSVIAAKPIASNWMPMYDSILDSHLGKVPTKFIYAGKEYTPKTFASTVLKFNPNDYVYLTSFTHHPYYEPFVLEVPDNFSNGAYYNIPLNEMIQATKDAVNKGYSVMWDADVSNDGFLQQLGYAVDMGSVPEKSRSKADVMKGTVKEGTFDAERRQRLFENLTTQDDHLMHIVGINKGKDDKEYFSVKNSWGEVGPLKGFINVSEGYFAINTVSLVVPKASLSKAMMEKLGIK